MEDLSFEITEMKSREDCNAITTICATCVQDNISLEIEVTDNFIKDKEFIKSLFKKEHTKITEQPIEQIKVGDVL